MSSPFVIAAGGNVIVVPVAGPPGPSGGSGGGAVTSVAGRTGVVVLTKTDVGLGSVDNVADASKPVSAAQQAALDGKQPLDSDLTAIAALAPADGSLLQRVAGVWNSITTAALKTALALVKGDVGLGNVDNTSDVTKNAAVATLTNKTLTAPAINSPTGIVEADIANLVSDLAGKQPLDSDLTTIAGLTATTDNMLQSVGSAWASRTPAQVKTALAIAESDVTSLVTDLAAKQPLDSDLTTIAGLTATTNNMLQSVGSAWASRTPTQVKAALVIAESDVTNLVTDLAAKAASVHTHAESDVTSLVTDLAGKQPLDSDLTTIAGLTATTDNFMVSASSAWASRTPAQAKASLAIVESDVTNLVSDLAAKQPLDSDLTTIAGLTATTDNMLQSVGSAWASRTPAQVKTALAISESDVTSLVTDLAAKVPKSLVTAKGDVITASGSATPVALAVGSDGQVLTADSVQTNGVKWATPSGGGGGATLTPTAVKTTTYTAAAGDFVPADSTSGGFTITLPTAPADKTQVGIKHVIQVGTNVVTYACGGSDVFNKAGGATSGTLPMLGQAVWLQYKSSSAIWYVLADDMPLSQLDLRFQRIAQPVAKTGIYTLVGTDTVILGDATSGGFTLTLPTAVAFTGTYVLSGIATNTNLVTVATTSSQTINGATTTTLGSPSSGAPWQSVTLVSDGANWRIV